MSRTGYSLYRSFAVARWFDYGHQDLPPVGNVDDEPTARVRYGQDEHPVRQPRPHSDAESQPTFEAAAVDDVAKRSVAPDVGHMIAGHARTNARPVLASTTDISASAVLGRRNVLSTEGLLWRRISYECLLPSHRLQQIPGCTRNKPVTTTRCRTQQDARTDDAERELSWTNGSEQVGERSAM
jgi:hypothetical protein